MSEEVGMGALRTIVLAPKLATIVPGLDSLRGRVANLLLRVAADHGFKREMK